MKFDMIFLYIELEKPKAIAIVCVANDVLHIFPLNEASISIVNLFCQTCGMKNIT